MFEWFEYAFMVRALVATTVMSFRQETKGKSAALFLASS